MPESLRLSLTLLTALPVRGAKAMDRRMAGRAMELAPVVGLVLGLLAAGVVFVLRVLDAPDLLAATLGIGTLALLTRGLHLDGLADLVDGLGSARDPEGTRAVMKAPDLGPFGAVALTLVLLIQVAALTSALDQHRGTVSLVLAVTAGRLAITAACARTPAATPDGLGTLVARSVRPRITSLWTAILACGFAAALALDGDANGSAGLRAVLAVSAVALSLLAARLLRIHAARRVGGLTGDALGALCEVATTVALVVLALGND